MRVFNVDFGRLILLLLPTFLRKAKLVLLIKSALQNVKDTHYKFFTQRMANILHINRNGQVCKLRGALNDLLDFERRRITINDIPRREYLMIFNDASQRFVELGTVEIWRDAYVGTEISDFLVNVPNELQPQEEQIIALLNKYKLASKRYTINYI